MNRIVFHLGSNLPWRNRYLRLARQRLRERVGEELRASAVYETSAWGVEDQADFLNQACVFRTRLSPEKALTTALEIEEELGRRRLRKWGERCIDIDLIFYENAVLNTPSLTLPHPWLQERRFVLVPLLDIVPDWEHPVFGKTVGELLEECTDQGGVVRVTL